MIMVENHIHYIDSSDNLRARFVDHYNERENRSLAVALQGLGEKFFLFQRIDDEVVRIEIKGRLMQRVFEI